MRRSVEIQPCSNRFVSIGSSFFHWGASSLSYRLRRSSGPVWSSFHTSPIRGLCLNRRGPRFYVRAFQDLDRIDRDLGFLPSARPEVFGPRVDFIPHCSRFALCENLVTPPRDHGGGQIIYQGQNGAKGDSNPRPLAPEARIMPLDH